MLRICRIIHTLRILHDILNLSFAQLYVLLLIVKNKKEIFMKYCMYLYSEFIESFDLALDLSKCAKQNFL